jgi:8-oxo-dGTP diphosphatase
MILLLYLCRQWRGEPRAIDAEALMWVTPAEMTGLAMPPADRPLIALLDALL